jgi:uncharacterized protein YfaS (alpha-2-macroglobulin family)
MQSSSGGFGWFQYDEGDPRMTAYVLEGLYWTQEAGLEINPHLRDRALEWAKGFAQSASFAQADKESVARLAYALALHGQDPGRLLPTLKEAEKSSLALAYIVLTKQLRGEQDAAAYQALIDRATETATTLAWDDDYWYEPTAVALMAVVKTEKGSPRAAKGLRYLMNKRRGNAWTSTRDTAQIVLAAIEYLRGTGELKPDFEAQVSVNGGAAHTFHFGPGDLSLANVLRVPVADLRQGQNEVSVRVVGRGRVYYSARLERTLYEPSPRPRDSGHGLKVKREYFRMQATRMEDGTLRLMPGKSPVTSARQGEVLRCRITVTSDRPREYVMVTDPALSNARAIDAGRVDEWDWYYWWSENTFLDDHTALFMGYLPAGESVVEYSVRAEALGAGIALPATASMMYQPDVRATTGTLRLEVRK